VNTLVLRADLSGQPDFVTILAPQSSYVASLHSRSGCTFEKIVERLDVDKRTQLRNPLFQVMFLAECRLQQAWSLPDVKVTPVLVTSNSAKFDLTLVLAEDGDAINGCNRV